MPRRRFPYVHLDVFTSTPLEGNQLAVVFEGENLPTATMQAIAREIGFSETVFIVPASSPAVARLRIFTPARELPMAGHPTIGSAFALAMSGRVAAGVSEIELALGIGPIPLRLEWREGTLAFAWMSQPLPQFGPVIDNRHAVATALALALEDLHAVLPVQSVSCGVPFVLVPVASRESVDRAAIDTKVFAHACAEGNVDPDQGVYVFAVEPPESEFTVYSRMFAPAFGVPEDPATGSASGPLGSYLVQHRVVDARTQQRIVSLQGVRMRRPSRIVIAIDGGPSAISGVRVGGTSVLVAEGTLFL
jgi:trans-2,3-dihydro-3-hydroxyanthranilate isomerase